jgi:anti-sigma regulatory factor (Ser/Thr protein kinase)
MPARLRTGRSSPQDARADPPLRGASFRLAPEAASAGVGRRTVRRALEWAPGDVADRVELLVSELVTNSIQHGGLRPEDSVDIRIRCWQRGVRVEVVDPGESFSPRLADPKPGEPGRWGFHLVKTLADRWGMEDLSPGKAVWFEVDL